MSDTGLGFEEAKFNKTGFCHRKIYSSVNALRCWRGLTKVSEGHCEATGLSENSPFLWWKGRKWETILKMNFWLKHEGEVHNAEDRRRGTPLQMGTMSQVKIYNSLAKLQWGKSKTWTAQPEWSGEWRKNAFYRDCCLLCEEVRLSWDQLRATKGS